MNKRILKTFILLFLTMSAFLPLASQTTTYKSFTIMIGKDTVDMQYETFDMEYFEKKKDIFGEIDDSYTKEDGTQVSVWGKLGQSFVILEYAPAPYFYTKVKSFYGDGRLEFKGIKLPAECYIGKWMECDEEGNCKIVDYDKGMGKFDYNDVLKFLDKRGYINLKTGEGKEDIGMGYNYENQIWHVSSFRRPCYIDIYTLDGKAGKIIEQSVRTIQN